MSTVVTNTNIGDNGMSTMKTLVDKFHTLENEVRGEILERPQEIHTSVLALLSRKHQFQVGPPGTAKSLTVERVCARIGDLGDEGYFRWLLTQYTTPDELFGGPDFNMLREHGIYKRVTEHKLPRAYVAFLDEALDLDTPILTAKGWRTIGDLEVGDQVYGSDGGLTTINALTPIKTEATCYRVSFSDGSSIVADAGHNWVVRSTGSHAWRTLTTEEVLSELDAVGYMQTPKHDPVELPHAHLDIDPYVLGLWLGNGNNFNGEIYVRPEWLDDTLANVQKSYPQARHLNTNDAGTLATISMADTGFRAALGRAGLIQNKHLPSSYAISSIQQRIELVRGLCDTDGYMEPVYNTVTFSNTNESIVDGVVSILSSLGIHATKTSVTDNRISELTGKPYKQCWKVHFRPTPKLNPFKSRNYEVSEPMKTIYTKIVSIVPEDSRPVRCITVSADDHCFLVGYNFVVTHNCFKGSSAILNTNLSIMNERIFNNVDDDPKVPLISMFGASNEVPAGDELSALWDRLHFRHKVSALRESSNFVKMLSTPIPENPTPVVSLEDIAAANVLVQQVRVTDDVFEALRDLRSDLMKASIEPSERRWVDAVAIIRAEAFFNGRDVADTEDTRPLMHVLWNREDDMREVRKQVLELANPLDRECAELLDRVHDLEGEFHRAQGLQNVQEKQRDLMEIFDKMKRLFAGDHAIKGLISLRTDIEESGKTSFMIDELNSRSETLGKEVKYEIQQIKKAGSNS